MLDIEIVQYLKDLAEERTISASEHCYSMQRFMKKNENKWSPEDRYELTQVEREVRKEFQVQTGLHLFWTGVEKELQRKLDIKAKYDPKGELTLETDYPQCPITAYKFRDPLTHICSLSFPICTGCGCTATNKKLCDQCYYCVCECTPRLYEKDHYCWGFKCDRCG